MANRPFRHQHSGATVFRISLTPKERELLKKILDQIDDNYQKKARQRSNNALPSLQSLTLEEQTNRLLIQGLRKKLVRE